MELRVVSFTKRYETVRHEHLTNRLGLPTEVARDGSIED